MKNDNNNDRNKHHKNNNTLKNLENKKETIIDEKFNNFKVQFREDNKNSLFNKIM